MTLQVYAALGHAVVSAPARSDELFNGFLGKSGLQHRIALRSHHHLSLPQTIEATELLATVPIATPDRYVRLCMVEMAPLPFPSPMFDEQKNGNARAHNALWLRPEIAGLFNDESEPWKAIKAQLHGNLRSRRTVWRR